jgi:hypothetical protein
MGACQCCIVFEDMSRGYLPCCRCRVILPDPKHPGSKDDIVIWVDHKYAAATEEEAEQKGAVAALHQLAGNRSLDYVLPSEYKSLWGELGEEVSLLCPSREQEIRFLVGCAGA